MKNILYTFLTFITMVVGIQNSNAQNDSIVEGKMFSYDFGIHYNFPEDVVSQQNSGAGFQIMPKYNFSNNNFIGLNFQYSNIFDSPDYEKSFSIMPSFQYFLNNTTLTPFIGFRAGPHFLSDGNGTELGITPSLGVSFNRFYDISMEYNMISNYENLITAKFTLSLGNSKTILERTSRFEEEIIEE